MSNCCCCCCPPKEPPSNGGSNGGGEPSSTRCDRYRVSIVSMNVTAIDDGFLGGDLEATFTFVVNGQARTWVNEDLDRGVHNIGITFFVDVPTDTSTITLEVSGVEDDPVSDDQLAGFTHVWGQAQNWGAGAQSGSASDSNITYSLNYEITCARETAVAVSRATLMAYAEERVKTRNQAKAASASTLLSWSLDRFRREGWEVIQATEDQFVLKGFGTFPLIVEQKYGEKKGSERAGR